jgi:hypothetical protein
VPNEMGQLQTIHGTRHLNVSENNVDVRALLKDCDSFIRVPSFDSLVAGFVQELNCCHAKKQLIFDHKDDRSGHAWNFQKWVVSG